MTPHKEMLDSKYFIYLLSSDYFLKSVRAKAEGTGVKSIAMKNLRKNGRGVEEKVSDMTIKDIAKESGYGIGTVSRVLNNNPNVSKKAYEKIMEVVNAHNYQPNPNARHLKMQALRCQALRQNTTC